MRAEVKYERDKRRQKREQRNSEGSGMSMQVNCLFHKWGDFPGGPVVKTALPLQVGQVPSPVRELRSCMPREQPKRKKKEKETQVGFNT